jgi:hypothetical protein
VYAVESFVSAAACESHGSDYYDPMMIHRVTTHHANHRDWAAERARLAAQAPTGFEVAVRVAERFVALVQTVALHVAARFVALVQPVALRAAEERGCALSRRLDRADELGCRVRNPDASPRDAFPHGLDVLHVAARPAS